MPQAPFDPCKQWLGIDALDLDDPRRVLGIGPHESDPLAVIRATTTRLSLLRGISSGPFELARAALIMRVEEAREHLLIQLASCPQPSVFPAPAAAPATPIDSSQRLTIPRPPGVPSAVSRPAVPAATFTPPVARVWASPAVSTDHAAAVALNETPDSPTQPDLFGNLSRRPQRHRAVSSGAGLLFTIFGGLVILAAALTLAVIQPDGSQDRHAANNSKKKPENKPSNPPNIVKPVSKPPLSLLPQAPPLEKPPAAKPPDPTPLPTPEPTPEPKPEPKPEPEPTEAEPQAIVKKIDALIAEAYSVMQKQQQGSLTPTLDSAEQIATTTTSRNRIARWKVLAKYSQEFIGYREQALKAVKDGGDYEVNGKKIGVVENTPEKFIYRVEGKNRTTTRDKMPAGILMAIVIAWFDAKPANNLFIGAYHITKPEPDLKKAREFWEKAEARGENAALLLSLLDDPVILNAPPE